MRPDTGFAPDGPDVVRKSEGVPNRVRVIVVGAGEVGFDIAKMLSSEGHDVVVIDRDLARVNAVREKLDAMAMQGNGAASETLKEAGVERSDMMIAVTTVDEVNIIACMMADRLGVETTIARIRSDEYTDTTSILRAGDFGIDMVIHPEESAAEEAARLIRRAGATDALAFADGRLQLLGMKITRNSPVLGKRLSEISGSASHLHYRLMAIKRGGRTILPRGKQKLMLDDQIFLLALTEDAEALSKVMLGGDRQKIHHVMILGGGHVGARLARSLAVVRKKSIKVIEPNPDRARRLAEALPNVLVLNGDPTDIDLLAAEGLAEMDAIAAVTDNEESNLVACLMAKHLGVRKTVGLLSKRAYIPISQTIGLDAAINVKLAVSSEVSRFLRGKHVLSVATIHGVDAEILELRPEAGSAITQGPLKDVELPQGTLVGAVIHKDRVEIATGTTHLTPQSSAIVFSLPHLTSTIEAYFNSR